MIISTGPRETHDYRDYNLWVPGYRFNKISHENISGKRAASEGAGLNVSFYRFNDLLL